MSFERLPPHRLDALTDEELVEYLAAAHEAGDPEAEREAMGRLAFGFEEHIRNWVKAKDVPDAYVEDVVIEAQISLLNASFEGKVIGQFGAFARTIAQRRAYDYWRKQSPRDKRAAKLGEEHEGEEGQAGVVVRAPEKTVVVDFIDSVNRVLARQSDLHQKVIRLYGPSEAGFLNLRAKEVVAAIEADESDDTVTAANVNQIWTRFKKALKGELADG